MSEQRVTYCRICEPLCGLIATVEDGVVTQLRPDKEHPVSRGFACPKGIAMTEVQNSPDRLTRPARRRADGSFESVSWEQALADIGVRLRRLRDQHGTDAIGLFLGNPAAFSYSSLVWVKGLMDALGSPHFYSSSSQDTNARLVASALLYGSPLSIPVPDLVRTDLALLLGANPVTSHGSMISGVNVREQLTGIVARGGRVVVVDPRRSETARLFEHVPIRPDGDAWMLLSLLHVLFDETLADHAALSGLAAGVDALRALVADFPPEQTAARSGVEAAAVRRLARDLAAAPSAAIYGRVGACTGSHGTLVCFLIDVLALATGNLDRAGGAVFPTPPIDLYGPLVKRGLDTYDTARSRIGDVPEVMGTMPAGVLAEEITTPGPSQLRAMLLVSGNPVLSVPEGRRLEAALQELELLVALDLGINDTNRHADYILPTTTFLEREDLPLQMFPYQLQTFVQWTEPVVAPRGEARQEWEILGDIAAELGLVPASLPALRRLGRVGRRLLRPKPMFDALLRLGPFGDRFGLRRGGISARRLIADHPHGIVLARVVPTGVLQARVTHDDGRLHVCPAAIEREVARLVGVEAEDAGYPLRLFGRRELRSINSWMKDSPALRRGGRGPTCQVHPDDAAVAGLGDGDAVRVASRQGSVEAVVELTADVVPGAISLPHGWGRRVRVDGSADGGGGPDYNALTSAGAAALEPLSGMSVLNGIRVRIARVTL
jgi:anaerobic selenocysteine-containing dehydrogenase